MTLLADFESPKWKYSISFCIHEYHRHLPKHLLLIPKIERQTNTIDKKENLSILTYLLDLN